MNDYRALLRAPRFRAFWLALLAANLGSWCVIATLPILVAERYGAGMVLVLSLGLRIVPKVLLAPLAGGLLRRFGPARVASSAMAAMAVLTAGLPWCDNPILFQATIGAIGTIDLFINPGLLALRGSVTPAGLSMAGNTMFSVADRAAKVAGPALGGVLVLPGFATGFAVFAAMTGLAAIPIARFSVAPDASDQSQSGSLPGFVRIVRGDRRIVGLLVASVTYMVMLGGLRPFLFWANRDWFGASDTAWTGLLVAQGAGALIGAVVSALFVGRFLRGMSAYTLTMLTGIIEGAIHLLLLFAHSSVQAMAILALAGIPEIISTSAWFTAMQERLAPAQQALFFTFAAPMWDLFFALGIASAGLHARWVLSLSSYWAMVSLIATLPLIPLLGRGPGSSRTG